MIDRHSAYMKTVFLVEPKDAEKAREIEARLVCLPPSSGILFAGVRVRQTDENHPMFYLTVGCSREFDESAIDGLVRVVLKPEFDAGLPLSVSVFRGISRSGSIKVDALL